MSGIPTTVRDAEATALKALYEAQKPRPTHGAFGKKHGLGSTGMVWQYLNAHRPLNLEAATKFAGGLGVPIERFSPRLAAAAALARGAGGNHMAVVVPAPAPIARDSATLVWPFPRLDPKKVQRLNPQQIRDLEAVMLLTAAQLGIHIAKRRAA
jgi:hypothetical protein